MASENILLRGISTTPTDRNTQDGGCSESLNVCLKDGELAAIQKPVDVTQAEIGAGTTNSVVPIYIHETSGYRHYIGKNSSNQVGYIQNGGSFTSFFTDSNPITAITSMGNTLIVSTDSDIHYVLWKDNQYKYLGTRVPEPDIEFSTRRRTSGEASFQSEEFTKGGSSLPWIAVGDDGGNEICTALAESPDEFGQFYNTTIYPQRSSHEAYEKFVSDSQSILSSLITSLIKKNTDSGFFLVPVLARYAVRLYDGSHIYISQPILLCIISSASTNTFTNASIRNGVRIYGPNPQGIYAKFSVSAVPFKAFYVIKSWQGIDDWKDIVKGIDIYISTGIYYPSTKNLPIKAQCIENRDQSVRTAIGYYQFEGDNDNHDTPAECVKEGMRDAILDKSLFYLVNSREINEITYNTEYYLKPTGEDDLVVKARLDESQGGDLVCSVGTFSSTNNRLIATGASMYASYGYKYLGGAAPGEAVASRPQGSCKVYYKISRDDGSEKWVCADASSWTKANHAKALLVYPNSKCTEAWVYMSVRMQPMALKKLPMKPHPMLDCAYWWGGFDTFIGDVASSTLQDEPTPNPVYKIGDNKILLSEVGNPFVFPVAYRVTVDASKVIGVSQATLDLSINLSEAYSLYAFTDKGIFAATLNSVGTISSLKFVCGDIALNGSLCVIDRGIVYITNRGVMIIQGQQIECISDNMIGRHFHLDSTDDAALIDILTTAGCNSAALTSAVQFSKFMENAKCIYDYKGARLIFVSTSTGCGGYGYVFMLTTETWHKADNTAALLDYIPNCYPKALGYKSGDSKIYDFSTNLSPDSNTLTEKGVIITRPLSLGATDIYKSIDALFLRGDFAKGNVKYLVLASNDGTNFHLLSSIKGPSWRYYRIVLVSSMTANERLAFVEAHTTEKFTNKPR